MAQSQDDPQVQKNGFRAIIESVDLDPEILEGTRDGGVSFFDDYFDPSATWDENVDAFRRFVSDTKTLGRKADRVLDSLE